MSDLALNRADVEKVRRLARDAQDQCVDSEGEVTDTVTHDSMEVLADFTEVLLGRGTVDGFLRAQDMED